MAAFTVNILNDENDGINVGSVSLRDAIAAANANPGKDIIEFEPSLTGTIALTNGELQITESVTIAGLGETLLTIDAQENSRVFTIDDGADDGADETVTISGITMTGGRADGGILTGRGGGILNSENVVLTNSIIRDNSARFSGGGIFNGSGSTMALTNSILSSNSATLSGGGLFNNSNSIITITTSTLNDNSSGRGGGIFNNPNSVLALTNSTLSGNFASSDGGGLFNYSATTTLANSTLSLNSAEGSGGGIVNYASATANLSNSLIAGNSADSDGNNLGQYGEILNTSSTVNSSGNNLLGSSELSNAEAFGGFIPDSSDVTATSDGSEVTPLSNIIDTTLRDNGGPTPTHALASDSPAIDGGSLDNTPVNIGASEECFLTGTHILTDQGEVPVEALTIGDRVRTADGTLQPVKWIGHQTRHPNQIINPLRSYPIHIKTGALGYGLPHRDLFVSPDHALLVDGLLINAGALVNDISILKTTPTDPFVYHHVELEQHALLVAEGTAAESYLPQKEDRLTYDNGAEYADLYPRNNILCYWPLKYARISSTRQLPRFVQKRLAQVAKMLDGQTRDVQIRNDKQLHVV